MFFIIFLVIFFDWHHSFLLHFFRQIIDLHLELHLFAFGLGIDWPMSRGSINASDAIHFTANTYSNVIKKCLSEDSKQIAIVLIKFIAKFTSFEYSTVIVIIQQFYWPQLHY